MNADEREYDHKVAMIVIENRGYYIQKLEAERDALLAANRDLRAALESANATLLRLRSEHIQRVNELQRQIDELSTVEPKHVSGKT